MPHIAHPTDRPNFAIVHLDNYSLAFSYETCIGVSDYGAWVVRENVWGPTTGKHLNYLNEDKDERLTYEKFQEHLNHVLKDTAPVAKEIRAASYETTQPKVDS